jgi:UDP-MurNAc hydroxylase
MQLKVHGHACLEVISSDKSLICDPWLVGSAYWRSWWNYPPLEPKIMEKVQPDYIYITHLHWDHFHGPTLRKIGTDKTVIIPKTPELRLLNDIRSVGFKNIIELPHGESFEIGKDFKITSYQFNPIFADSAIVIETDETVIFNSNDAKIMGSTLDLILRTHPKIDFLLKSHSSANSRVCYEVVDQESKDIDHSERYIKDFCSLALAVNPKYVVPFASNQCCLHPETIQYNNHSNYSYNVLQYFAANGITSPKCVLMAPGDVFDSEVGFAINDNSEWYVNRDNKITAYLQSKFDSISKSLEKENKSKMNLSLATKYAEWIIRETPFFVKLVFRGVPITIIANSSVETKAICIDLFAGSYHIITEWDIEKNPIQIYVNSYVLNDIWAKRHWNSLGVSKRLRVKLKNKHVKHALLFNFLNNALEAGSIQLRYVCTPRYIFAWSKRWRELLLYIKIILSLLIGNSFVYQNYLPKEVQLETAIKK